MLARLLLESPPSRVRERRDLLDALEAYLAELWWNGQIHRDHLISRAPLAAYVDLPRQGALSVQFHSAGGKKALARFEAQYGVTVSWNLLESRPLRRHRSWRSASSLYLFTHAFDTHAPLCVDGLDDAAPLYLLPITERARMDLQGWASDYRDHDRMWLSSGRLEMRAYRELADPTSVLCSRGRDLCRMIEKATRKPTYFYLQRYYAHHKANKNARVLVVEGTGLSRAPTSLTRGSLGSSFAAVAVASSRPAASRRKGSDEHGSVSAGDAGVAQGGKRSRRDALPTSSLLVDPRARPLRRRCGARVSYPTDDDLSLHATPDE